MTRPLATLLAAFAVLALVGCAGPQAHFGEPMKHDHQRPLSVARVMANPDDYDGEYVRVAGTVHTMCTTSGCWMELVDAPAADDAEGLVVVFTYDRATHSRVPPEAIGHKAVVEGKLVVKSIPEEQRRHMAADAGASVEELERIKGPAKSVRLECPAARIAGVKPAAPKACEHADG